jgi:hypothetical protein
MSATGLVADSEEPAEGEMSTGNQQVKYPTRNHLIPRPDAVAVIQILEKIAILDHGRPYDRDD